MKPQELEQAVFDMDEIRVVVRANTGTDLDDYKFVRKAAGSASLTDWLDQRIRPLLRGHEVAVVDGNGVSPHGRTQIEKVRASYVT
jgi:hypothetical protein